MRIIFYGTPEFAVASLDALNREFEIIAVVTAPDKPAGRGLEIRQSAVKKFAVANNIPLLQPDKLKSEEFIAEVRKLMPDLQVVVAFRMMPEILWSLPPQGTINLHASLLPDYRGAAPINWAIINGDQITGLTTFFINEKIDTGDILLQQQIPIGDQTTAGELHDVMKEAGAELLVRTVKMLGEKSLVSRSQSTIITKGTSLRSAPKLDPSNCRINWDMKAIEVHNQIRGLSPYPAAFTTMTLKGIRKVKIFQSTPSSRISDAEPGTMLKEGNKLLVACADEYLEITALQPEGKRRMTSEEFLNGLQVTSPIRFE